MMDKLKSVWKVIKKIAVIIGLLASIITVFKIMPDITKLKNETRIKDLASFKQSIGIYYNNDKLEYEVNVLVEFLRSRGLKINLEKTEIESEKARNTVRFFHDYDKVYAKNDIIIYLTLLLLYIDPIKLIYVAS